MEDFRHYSPWRPGKVSSRSGIILSDLKGCIDCMIIGLKSQIAFGAVILFFLWLSTYSVLLERSHLTSVSNTFPKSQRG